MTDRAPACELQRVYSSRIAAENGITDRCLRKWISEGKFPPPDGNLHGRNFWLPATYHAWQADVIAGKFRQARRPVRATSPAAA